MKDKIRHLMNSEGLTSSRFAEILEIQPSGVSHLLSGRNKPGFELLQKILSRFPRVSPDWLLLGKGEIYRDDFEPTPLAFGGVDLFGDENFLPNQPSLGSSNMGIDLDVEIPSSGVAPTSAAPAIRNDEYIPSWESADAPATESLASAIAQNSPSGARPRSVIVFYDDGSCESFKVR